MSQLKRPSKCKNASVGGFDGAKDLNASLVPAEMPAENGRNDDDQESIWYKHDRGESRFKTLFKLAVLLSATQ